MYKIYKEITAEDNRKALKKAAKEITLFITLMGVGYTLGLYALLAIWSY